MISLFIDTHSQHLNIAILKDTTVLSCIKKEEKEHSTKTLAAIEKCLKNANLKIEDVDRIYAVTGPGSFTGLRIGVTIAKTLAYTLNKEVIAVSSLLCYALSNKSRDVIFVPVINARRNFVFATIVDEENNIILKEQYIHLDELQKEVLSNNKKIIYLSYDEIPNIDVEKPDFDFSRIVSFYQSVTPTSSHNLVPNYLKKTEAEENLL